MSIRVALLIALLPVTLLAAEKFDVSTAQLEMYSRIEDVVEKRAKELGLDEDAVAYCRIDLNAHTDQFPKNGSIPFGVNYNQISTAAELKAVIRARESYEKTYMLLCLARVKRELSARG